MSKDINLLFERFRGQNIEMKELDEKYSENDNRYLVKGLLAEQYFYLTIAHYFPSSDSFLLFTVVSCECY